MDQPDLLFVYNAKAGPLNGLLDTLHKTLSPATYACSLCALTYGATSMKPEWRQFLQELPATATFLHRDELHRLYPKLATHPLPAVFRRDASGPWQVFLTPQELRQPDLADLIDLVRHRLTARRNAG
ncbi:hypothetical protein LRS06_19640 [Hymenobacter sp. J193]|uniref:hypothetical protein n=1 Tax=Hymenobacter sp. J193 TaxID=2898429 RepID=UPI0021506DD3|nr:hypothetical protein [Hymenobacter sp. J193]MCR5889945.1 hypothetical protein [Hymenobacter sp. J193]